MPKILERPLETKVLTVKQVDTAKKRREAGASFQKIAEDMGVSIETVHKYAKNIKPKLPDGETPTGRFKIPDAPVPPDGGEKPVVQASKPSMVQIPVDLDPEMMLGLAGIAWVQGFTSLKEYVTHHAVPWLNAFRESAELLGADTPKDFVQRLKIVVDGYWEYQRIVEKAQEKVEKPVVKSDGRELPAK